MARIRAGEFAVRTEALREAMARARIDGLLLTSEADVRYVSGFSGSESALLVGKRGSILITDFRYEEEARNTCPHAQVRLHKNGLMRTVAAEARRRRMKRLGYDPGRLTVLELGVLKEGLGARRLARRPGLVASLRMVKSPAEVEAIRRCLGMAEKAYTRLWKRLEPGTTESEAAAELEYIMRRRLGATGPSFETIVAFDDHASEPHAKPSARRLKSTSIVLIDWGARADFYNCDLTRTRPIGRIPRKFAGVRDVVLEAQRRAIEAIEPGVEMRKVDAAARTFIASQGYGEAFGHALGHSVGLEIHEGPRLSSRAKGRLEPGMVVTVEPGIYLPGEFGIRIEDMVLVTDGGAETLSSLART